MNSKNDLPGPTDQFDAAAAPPSEPAPVRQKHNIGMVLLIAGAVLIVLGFLMFHKPRRYRPKTPENPSEVSTYLTHHLAPDLNNNIQLDEPFNMVIEENGFNDIISRGVWPLDYGYVRVSAPAVEFTDDSIVIMATVAFSSVRSVITAAFRPKLDEQGQLYLNLQYVKIGSVRITVFARSLTRAIITEQLENVEDSQWRQIISDGILGNLPFEPVFVAYDKKIRLSRIELHPGRARLTFKPELEK
jgi:hypothetical protein